MFSPPRFVAGFALALGMTSLVALPAQAGPEVLKRSFSNLVGAPFDAVLSPAVAGMTMVDNLQTIGDSPGVRYFYPPFGFVWLTGVQLGASVLRGISGALEFPVGLALLPFDVEMPPLFDPAERGEALVDQDTPVIHFKIGIDYTSPPS